MPDPILKDLIEYVFKDVDVHIVQNEHNIQITHDQSDIKLFVGVTDTYNLSTSSILDKGGTYSFEKLDYLIDSLKEYKVYIRRITKYRRVFIDRVKCNKLYDEGDCIYTKSS